MWLLCAMSSVTEHHKLRKLKRVEHGKGDLTIFLRKQASHHNILTNSLPEVEKYSEVCCLPALQKIELLRPPPELAIQRVALSGLCLLSSAVGLRRWSLGLFSQALGWWSSVVGLHPSTVESQRLALDSQLIALHFLLSAEQPVVVELRSRRSTLGSISVSDQSVRIWTCSAPKVSVRRSIHRTVPTCWLLLPSACVAWSLSRSLCLKRRCSSSMCELSLAASVPVGEVSGRDVAGRPGEEKTHQVMVRLRLILYFKIKKTLHVNRWFSQDGILPPKMILFQLIDVCISTDNLTCCGRSHVLQLAVI